MIRFKNVLCPVDFFPASDRAVEYATAIARNYKATLHLLHVVSPIMPTSYEYSINTADLLRQFQDQAARKVDQMRAAAAAAGVQVETEVPTGDIDEELKKAFGATRADIVVMGTHGRRGFERWFIGSVTERVLRHCPVPALTISDAGKPIRVPPDVEKILVTTDFSEGTGNAMAYAFALAAEAPARVTLLHVVQQPPEHADGVEDIASLLEEHLASMVPPEIRQWCEVESKVAVGTPFRRILATAEEIGADLIVMNIHGKGVIERTLMGATAERVLRGAECPVLAVPASAPAP